MHSEWIELVERLPLAPPLGEWGDTLVCRDDSVEVRRAEERQHREVTFSVASVRGLSLIHISEPTRPY